MRREEGERLADERGRAGAEYTQSPTRDEDEQGEQPKARLAAQGRMDCTGGEFGSPDTVVTQGRKVVRGIEHTTIGYSEEGDACCFEVFHQHRQ